MGESAEEPTSLVTEVADGEGRNFEPDTYPIRVRNLSNPFFVSSEIIFFATASDLVYSFVKDVAKRFSYELDSFTLAYILLNGEEIELTKLPSGALMSSVGFTPRCSGDNLLILKKCYRRELHPQASGSSVNGEIECSQDSSLEYVKQINIENSYKSSSSYISNSYSPSDSVSYVGLVNQAMTCYLNSLLQALFMTPEFRNAIYHWEFKGTEEESLKSIPFQLQKLFLQLQTTSRSAVETTNLTRSFGWDSSEVWQQHDIQELYRIMLDALEQQFKNTAQADLVSGFYEGTMNDYVKCLSCGTENAKEDKFLDIPLPIRPFGSNSVFKSVEEALRAFVAPELLTDNNKYECSKCGTLCDAHKGLKFVRFPYLLTLHLKRFDFDYQTFHRVKLNDKVVFPNVLDLNSFVEKPPIFNKTHHEDSLAATTPADYDVSPSGDSGSAFDGEENSSAGPISAASFHEADTQDEDEGIDLNEITSRSDLSASGGGSSSPGPYVYDLFSIMIHSGSASGGHYYAFIKDFESNDWFCFNDQVVSRITDDDIRRTYGRSADCEDESSSSGGWVSSTLSNRSSANAYMLMYRMVDKERNSYALREKDFPAHIQALVQKMIKEEAVEREIREIDRHMCKMKVFCKHRKGNNVIKVHKDTTVKEVTRIAYEHFSLESVAPLERCRLVKYDEIEDFIEHSFGSGMDDKSIWEALSTVGIRSSAYKFDLLLEVLEEGELEFEEYKSEDIMVKVFVVDLETEQVADQPRILRVDQNFTVCQFKQLLSRVFSCQADHIHILLERRCNKVYYRPLIDPCSTLKQEDMHSSKVFIEISSGVQDSSSVEARMLVILERLDHVITISVHLPERNSELLKERGIPEYNCSDDKSESVVVNGLSNGGEDEDSLNTDDGRQNGFSVNGCEDNLCSSSEVSCSANVATSCSQCSIPSPPTCNSSVETTPPCSISPPSSSSKVVTSSVGSTLSQSFPAPATKCASFSSSKSSVVAAPSSLTWPSSISDGSSTHGPVFSPPPPPLKKNKELEAEPAVNHFAAGQSVSCSAAAPPPPSSLSSDFPAALSNLCDGDDCSTGLASGVSSDQSTSEDSSLTSDSERTLVGDPPAEDNLSDQDPDYDNIVSPSCDEENGVTSHRQRERRENEEEEEDSGLRWHKMYIPPSPVTIYDTAREKKYWDDEEDSPGEDRTTIVKRYFRVVPSSAVKPDLLEVQVDRRMTVEQLKQELQPFVGVSDQYFKMFFFHSDLGHEVECNRLNKTLSSFGDGCCTALKVSLERPLLPGEYKGKVFMLEPNNMEDPARFLVDFVIRKDDLVGPTKEAIIQEVNAAAASSRWRHQRNDSDASVEKSLDPSQYRLRKKSWKSPLTVLLDNETFDDAIILFANWELYLQKMDAAEPKTNANQLCFFARRWRASSWTLDPLVDLTLPQQTNEALAEKLSAISSIPVDRLEVALGRLTFPNKLNLFEVVWKLKWNSIPPDGEDEQPFHISDDGYVLFYRDSSEVLDSSALMNPLTPAEKAELSAKERAQLNREATPPSALSSISYPRSREEKALKIYLDHANNN